MLSFSKKMVRITSKIYYSSKVHSSFNGEVSLHIQLDSTEVKDTVGHLNTLSQVVHSFGFRFDNSIKVHNVHVLF